VPSPGIVEALDVIEHVGPGVIARPVDQAGCPLGFSDEKKLYIAALSQMLPRTAHRAGDAVIGHQALELLAPLLAALVAVVQQAVRFASAPDRHDEGVGDEPLDIELLRLHLTVAGKGVLRIGRQAAHPFAQHKARDAEKKSMRFLQEAEEPPPLLHPNMAHRYRAQVDGLYAALQENSEETRMIAAELVRSRFKEIILTPEEPGMQIDVRSDLPGIPSVSLNSKRPAGGAGQLRIDVVAGVGFEPTTFRL
jgi:hypothetical protein